MADFLFSQDLQLRIQKHTEVETVDLVLKLKDKLVGIVMLSFVFSVLLHWTLLWSYEANEACKG